MARAARAASVSGAALAALVAFTGCDPGPAGDASTGIGPPIHLVSANVSGSQSLPANGTIQLEFDRLLLPVSITRQTFVTTINPPPLPSYDPVTRIVSITPLAPLVPGQTYEIEIAAPQSPTDLNGLRAIDGATIDPKSAVIAFQASAPATQPPPIAKIDYCQSIQPILGTCGLSICHSGNLPAAGLNLSSAPYITATAIGRVAHGSNTGPSALPQAPGLSFAEDMPIIDPGTGGAGDPAHSWLIYKVLLGKGLVDIPDAGPGSVQWTPLSDSERAILGNYVDGREMPYPASPAATTLSGLSSEQMETLSLWIAQGASLVCAPSGG
jgi:hypothetical protein